VGTDHGHIKVVALPLRVDGFDIIGTSEVRFPDIFGVIRRCLAATIGWLLPAFRTIEYFEESAVVAAIDDESRAAFFTVNWELQPRRFLRIRNMVTFAARTSPDHEIVAVSALSAKAFVAFTRSGTRLVYQLRPFAVRNTLLPPPELNKEDVECACASMGFTIMMTRQSVLILRAQRYDSENICEFVESYTLPGHRLSLGVLSPAPHYRDPLIWQHFSDPPSLFLLTSSGGWRASLSAPIETLKRLVLCGADLQDWFNTWNAINEADPTAVLLASRDPDCAAWILQAGHSSPDGFDRSVARIVSQFWNAPILCKTQCKKDWSAKWKVNPVFANMSPSVILQLRSIRALVTKYIKLREHAALPSELRKGSRLEVEGKQLGELGSFLDFLIQTLLVIGHIAQQRSRLTTEVYKAMCNDDGQIVVRLEADGFAQGERELFLVLKDFMQKMIVTVKLSRELQLLAAELAHSCPLYVPAHLPPSDSELKSEAKAIEISEGAERATRAARFMNNMKGWVKHGAGIKYSEDVDALAELVQARADYVDPLGRADLCYKYGTERHKDWFDKVWSVFLETFELSSNQRYMLVLRANIKELLFVFVVEQLGRQGVGVEEIEDSLQRKSYKWKKPDEKMKWLNTYKARLYG
jgi:hypothetical protein